MGKWEGIGPWKWRVFWALWNGIEPIGECHLGPKKLEISRAQSPPTCAEIRSQSSHFSQHSVFVLIFNNKLGKEISTHCYFFPFSADATLFPVRYSYCFSFPSPSEDVYKGTGVNFYSYLSPYWSSYLYVKVWRENKLQFLFPGARLPPELLWFPGPDCPRERLEVSIYSIANTALYSFSFTVLPFLLYLQYLVGIQFSYFFLHFSPALFFSFLVLQFPLFLEIFYQL